MTENNPSPLLLDAPPASKPKSQRLGIALLITVLVLTLSGWLYSTLVQRDLIQRLSNLEIERSAASRELLAQRTQLTTQGKNFEQLQARQNEALTSLQQQSTYLTQQLAQLASGTRSDWLLAEAEYLLRLANQRMNLEGDSKGAEAMLQTADQVLAEIADPGLFAVRAQLAKEILDIQVLRPADREQTFAQLHALVSRINTLKPGQLAEFTHALEPENKTSEPAETPTLWQQIKSDLLRVFHIRRLDQPVQPLMAPEQSYYLQQNLRLMLEQASHALLSQENAIYQNSLAKTELWLQRYFDSQNPEVLAMQNTISALKLARISTERVDISESLRLLRQHIEMLYRHHLLSPNLSPNLAPTQSSAAEASQ